MKLFGIGNRHAKKSTWKDFVLDARSGDAGQCLLLSAHTGVMAASAAMDDIEYVDLFR